MDTLLRHFICKVISRLSYKTFNLIACLYNVYVIILMSTIQTNGQGSS